MNLLHGLPVDTHGRMFGSINPPKSPDPDKVVCTVRYTSPILVGGPQNVAGRLKNDPSAHTRRIRFAGAWTGLGTHEDGWVSGITVAEELGAVMPWAKVDRSPRVPERNYVELLCVTLLEMTIGRFWGRLLSHASWGGEPLYQPMRRRVCFVWPLCFLVLFSRIVCGRAGECA
jgi:hypothetical protein